MFCTVEGGFAGRLGGGDGGGTGDGGEGMFLHCGAWGMEEKRDFEFLLLRAACLARAQGLVGRAWSRGLLVLRKCPNI